MSTVKSALNSCKCCISRFFTNHIKSFNTPFLLFIHIFICGCAFYFIPSLYSQTLKKLDISIRYDSNIKIGKRTPVWFSYSHDTIYVSKTITDEDKSILYALVDENDSLYQSYTHSIDKLAYKSNIAIREINTLLYLTLCFVALGCCARTFYDYIGRKCYSKNQEMDIWWPWYFFRPIIGIPIATFLLIAVKTAMFSAMYTTKDLHTYLIVSFFAGFSMMEFLTMLRRTSKGVFGDASMPKDNNESLK